MSIHLACFTGYIRLTALCLLSSAIFLLTGCPAGALAADSPGAEKIPVIVYHEVLANPGEGDAANVSVVSLRAFAEQMEYLHSNGFYTASMSELEGYVRAGRRLPPKTVVITFDDGYQSNYLYAYPYLSKYNFKFTLFLMGSVPPKARPHLTGYQLTSMVGSGLLEIGCHTYGLHRYIDEAPALLVLPEQDIAADFTVFNALCGRMGIKKSSTIAYPYGAANTESISAAAGAGYRMGFNITDGYVRTGDPLMNLNRFNIGPEIDLDAFAAIVSGTAQWIQ